jgi:hypothetical protein
MKPKFLKYLMVWRDSQKKIEELESEIEALYEELNIHQWAMAGLSARLSTVEKIIVTIGLADYKQPKEEDALLN